MRLRVNLCGNKPLSGTVFAQDQDGAVTFGNPRNSALNARLGRMGWPRLPLFIVDHCNCCHMGTKVHVIVSMQVLCLAVKYAEYASIAGYGLGENASSGNAEEGAESFPPTGKQCTINCPGKWNSFSTITGRRIPNRRGVHGGISLNRTVSLSAPDCVV